jgi:hypothetical protein
MSRPLFTVTFWVDTAERAVKGAAVGVFTALGLSETRAGQRLRDGLEVRPELGPRRYALSSALGGAFVSLLMSLGSAPIGEAGTASALKSPPGPEAPPEDRPVLND